MFPPPEEDAPGPAESERRRLAIEPELDEGDLALLHWMLSLSPIERLEALQDFIDGIQMLRDGRVG